jgi:two-component system, cell cycle response regulator
MGRAQVARPKILLVDDTRLILELEKSFLKCSDIEVLTAGNGVEALEMIRRDPPNLVFMDMNMPEMDGITCCSTIKADPFLCEIPVIMLTTEGREGERERAAQAGCDDYLTKPIDRRAFLEKARKYTKSVDRRELRVHCHIPALILAGNTAGSGHVVDLSDNGAFIASHQQVRRDAQLRLAFYLPGSSPALFDVSGRVAWVNEEGKRVKSSLPAGFGVEIPELPEKDAAALKECLDSLRGGQPSS